QAVKPQFSYQVAPILFIAYIASIREKVKEQDCLNKNTVMNAVFLLTAIKEREIVLIKVIEDCIFL
ncbi:MAG TPA: hypothetical protein PLI19_06245, partial [Erysipelotrichaceae bacterium]|nr:hypothetical protein [Erysipelotrichaceae bacterium]